MREEPKYFGPFCFDAQNSRVSYGPRFEHLPPKACEVLRMLIDNAGNVVERRDLEGVCFGGSLAYQISFLRNKVFGKYGARYRKYIETVSKKGYRFVEGVRPGTEQVSTAGAIKPLAKANQLSLAIIPFNADEDEDEDEELQDGMTTALTGKLSNVQDILVTPYSTVQRVCAELQDPLAVGRELGVTAILQGTATRTADRIRATVELLQVSDGSRIWIASFDEEFWHIFRLHSTIALRCAEQLAHNLTSKDRQQLARLSTRNREAYELYVKARKQWNLRTAEGLDRAIGYFNDAVVLDPQYSAAFAGLADCYNLRSYYCGINPRDTFPRALECADRALEIDPSLPEAHTARAYAISRCYWKWIEAEKEYKQAISLKNSYATGHQWYAEFLTAMGRFDEALNEIEIARSLDSHSPIINASFGTVLYFSDKIDEAIRQYRMTIRRYPDFVRTHFRLARALIQKQQYGEAIAECKTGLKLSRGNKREMAQLAQVYAFAGRTKMARSILADLLRLSEEQYVSEYSVAIVYVGLGEHDEAINMLEKAYWSHDPWLEHLNVDPRLNDLRPNPRFHDLVKRVDLPNSKEA